MSARVCWLLDISPSDIFFENIGYPVFTEAGTHLPTPKGWTAELALGSWLVTYRNKCPAPGIEPGHVTVASLTTVTV